MMDYELRLQLTLFAHGFTPSILVRRSELPSAAAYLAIAGVAHYRVETVAPYGEEWYQLSLAYEPLWRTAPPLLHTPHQPQK